MWRIASESPLRGSSRWFGWQGLSHSLDRSVSPTTTFRFGEIYGFAKKRAHRRISSVRERDREFRCSRFNIEPQGRCRLVVIRSRDTLNFQSTYNATGITRRIRGTLLSAIHRAFQVREVILEIGRRGNPRDIHRLPCSALVHGPNMDYALSSIACRRGGGGGGEKEKNRNTHAHRCRELWCTVALAGRRCYLLWVVLFTVPRAL